MDQHGVIIAHLGSSLGLWGEKVSIPRATGLCKFNKHTKTRVKVRIPRATGSPKLKKHKKTCVKSTFSKATVPLKWDDFERGGSGKGYGMGKPIPWDEGFWDLGSLSGLLNALLHILKDMGWRILVAVLGSG